MATRTSSAHWQGDLSNGSGDMTLGSGAFTGPYSFPSRFESGPGTNPEELIAAAHAGCFSMALAHILSEAGHIPAAVDTSAAVHLGAVAGGFAITRIDLTTRVDVAGITPEEFHKHAEAAKSGCPVSKALAAIDITLDAALV